MSNRERGRCTLQHGERERVACWLREKGEIASCGLTRKLAREMIELVAVLMEGRERGRLRERERALQEEKGTSDLGEMIGAAAVVF